MATSTMDRSGTALRPRRAWLSINLCVLVTLVGLIVPALSIFTRGSTALPFLFWMSLVSLCPLVLIVALVTSLFAGMWATPARRWRSGALLLSALVVTWSTPAVLLMAVGEPACPDNPDAAIGDDVCGSTAAATAGDTLFTGVAGAVALVALVVAALAVAWWVRELRRHESSLNAGALLR